MRILYLNELTPDESTASAIVLARHMRAASRKWVVMDEEALPVPRWLQTVRNRVLLKWAPGLASRLEQHWETRAGLRALAGRLQADDYDLVLTLAHGRLGLHAWRIAERLNLPLATLFHDWWPEVLETSAGAGKPDIETARKDFLQLQRRSDLCFAVCEGMASRLKEARRTEVLLPIPDETIASLDRSASLSGKLRITYAGSLWPPYGTLIASLADELANEDNLQFNVYGERRYLDRQAAGRMESRGQLSPMKSMDNYKKTITEESDLLLGVMGQDRPGKCRMQTSFPSKVANYFRTGNPTMLWAPPESSLGQFARAANLSLYEPVLDARHMAQHLRSFASDPAARAAAKEESIETGKRYFDPGDLNRIFYGNLESLLR